jgi:hypothetical protein
MHELLSGLANQSELSISREVASDWLFAVEIQNAVISLEGVAH